GAITEAVKTKYPMDQFIGVWWSGQDADLRLVGEEGAGYKSISWSFPNPEAPVHGDLETHVVDTGKSLSNPEEMAGVFYNRGLVMSMILAEGIRAAQEEYGTAMIDPGQLRWGLENLDITSERLEELGMTNMVPPFSTSCANHTGHAGGWMLEWDGEKFAKASDLITPNVAEYRELLSASAEEYAAANAPWAVNEDCNAES
ncbi:MAG: ABC transporter permease, partial [Pseudomonadota bacterium]